MSLTLLPWTVNPVAQGTLQGLQRFTWFGSNLFLSSFLRLAFGMVLVWVGWGAAGALAGGALGSGVMGLVALMPLAYLWPLRTGGGSGLDLRELVRYSGGVLLATACFSVLTNVDVIVVKRFFPPLEAGYYSAASTLGKVALWLPGAVSMVMFPKSSFRHASGQDASSIARRSVGVVALLCVPVVLGYFFFPRFFVQLLFGGGYQPSEPLVYVLGLAMAVYAVNNVVVLYYLSIRKQAFLAVIVAVAVCQVGALIMVHGSLTQVVWVVVTGGLFLLVLSEVVCRGLSGGWRRVSSEVGASAEMPEER
jgi:O-antigen/teichoic acid export membrane protein